MNIFCTLIIFKTTWIIPKLAILELKYGILLKLKKITDVIYSGP